MGISWLTCSQFPFLLTQLSLHRDGLLPNHFLQDRCSLTHLLWGTTHTVWDSTKVCVCGVCGVCVCVCVCVRVNEWCGIGVLCNDTQGRVLCVLYHTPLT